MVIGPIAFVGLRGYRHGPDRFFQPRNGRYRALKVLAVATGAFGIVIAVIVILFVILAVVASLIVANLGDPTF